LWRRIIRHGKHKTSFIAPKALKQKSEMPADFLSMNAYDAMGNFSYNRKLEQGQN
jgi:hypothetical protein